MRVSRLYFLFAVACPSPPETSPTESTPLTSSGTCGNRELDDGEQCDHGGKNSDSGACTLNCMVATCGDGLIWAEVEDCDEGSVNDSSGACTPDCTLAVCGDGYLWSGVEECDLGSANRNEGDCTASCTLPACGDGWVQAGVDECDDGNNLGGDRCSPACALPSLASLSDSRGRVFGSHIALASGYDLNADGFDDVLVGETEGAVVLLGPVVGDHFLSEADLVVIESGPTVTSAGASVAIITDVNADGLPDMAIGAPQNDDVGSRAGAIYVIHGGSLGTMDLANSPLVIYGKGADDELGQAMASAGDFNGDGLDDLVVSAVPQYAESVG